MTCVVGMPFEGGFVVSSDSASEWGPGRPAATASKLRRAGGVLYTCSGIVEVGAPTVVWSVHDAIAGAAPSTLSEADLPELARAISCSLELWAGVEASPYGAEHMGLAFFAWWRRRVGGFVVRIVGPHRVIADPVFAFPFDPGATAQPLFHGVDLNATITQPGKLSDASHRTMARRICEVSEYEARAVAVNIQEAAAREFPGAVGGAIDLAVVRAPAAAA